MEPTKNKYRVGYTLYSHYTSEYNYPQSEIIDTGYIEGKTIEDLKQKVLKFVIDRKLGIFGTINHFFLNSGRIDGYTLQKFKRNQLDIEGQRTIEFDDYIEEIPETIPFDFDKLVEESDEQKEEIGNFEKFIEDTLHQRKEEEKKRLGERLEKIRVNDA
jgi:hypothetical protein